MTTPAQEAEADKSSAERLVLFSDAVIAIAITLLAIELPVPHGETLGEAWRSFGEEWHEYLAFLISFAVIGTQWLSHHAVFRYVDRMPRRLGQLNLLWLLAIVITPFTTRVLVSEVSFPMAFTLYAAVQALGSLVFLLIILMIRRDGLAGDHDDYYRGALGRTAGFLIAFLISIPVAFGTQWAYALWGLVPLVLGRIRRRRRGPEEPLVRGW